MCRGFQDFERERLTTEAIYLRLRTISGALDSRSLPDSLTLHYLPRINGTPLDINGSAIRADSPAFVTLHRLVSEKEAVYGSRDRVTANEGASFEVYLRDTKLLKGVFRKDESNDEWRLECRSLVEAGVGVREVEVCVAVKGQAAMREKLEVVVRRRKNCFKGLEEIPEERETESECTCCDCCGEIESGGSEEEEEIEMCEMEVEGVRWAMDVGIWVMCLGVGYLVTKASSKSLRRTRRLF